MVAVLYYRAQELAGNTGFVDTLCAAIEACGARPMPVWCASLRTAGPDLLDTLAQVEGEIATGLISVYTALGGGWELRLTGCTPSAGEAPCPVVRPTDFDAAERGRLRSRFGTPVGE